MISPFDRKGALELLSPSPPPLPKGKLDSQATSFVLVMCAHFLNKRFPNISKSTGYPGPQLGPFFLRFLLKHRISCYTFYSPTVGAEKKGYFMDMGAKR